MDDAYPFAGGRHLTWELTGFGADDELVACARLTREQFLRVRHLFDLGDDVWMMSGEYPVDSGLREAVTEILGIGRLDDGVDYFLGARQDLPGGQVWSPAAGAQAPGPVPAP
ncbi:hypothetical protein [Streptomyces sp. NPDC101150]|uniref:hypothetical protein n=1 Tax=Streptomyces sp. NPDC101150 TaxID=3366114 RepID=UPI0037F201AD